LLVNDHAVAERLPTAQWTAACGSSPVKASQTPFFSKPHDFRTWFRTVILQVKAKQALNQVERNFVFQSDLAVSRSICWWPQSGGPTRMFGA
jgi:hypothetical protein